MTRHFSTLTGLALLALCTCAYAEAPLLYLPFDGSAQAALSGGDASVINAAGSYRFKPGLRGKCVELNADCRYNTAGNFNAAAGTVAVWLRPNWKGNDGPGHYLFCLYGSNQVKDSWMHNRWSVLAAGGKLNFGVYPAGAGMQTAVEAPVGDWQPGQWHHVAVTWENLNSGKADAQLCLYVDGKLAAQKGGLQIDVGPVSDTLDVGRDSDGSPDYGDADFDEFYLYGRALSADEIAKAVALVTQPEPAPRSVVAGKWRSDWWEDAWHFRCRANVDSTTPGIGVRLPLDFQTDLSALGVAGALDPASLRVVPCEAKTGQCAKDAKPLAVEAGDGELLWRLPERGGQQVQVYFDVIALDAALPLFVRAAGRSWPEPRAVEARRVPDYATDTYGDAWDFNEGDFEGIDQWGNHDWCLKNKQVKDGVLSVDVSEDPWFIWGNMWSQVGKTERPVAIDLAKYPVLKMKVRQSCPVAQWEVLARVGRPELLTYKFEVKGQGWQVVRVDLRKDARWAGVMDAFRIDPTSEVAEAHVDIDWIRLTNETEGQRAAVETLGQPTGQVATLTVAVERKQAQVGSRQTVTVRATDKSGAPVAGQPVSVQVTTNGDGRLEADPTHRTLTLDAANRRGLTDADGKLTVTLVSSRTVAAAADAVAAVADFAGVQSTSTPVGVLAGPPHHYRVTPTRPTCLRAREFPLPVAVQLVDEFDNPLPVAGRRVTLATQPGATLAQPNLVTDAKGHAQTTMTVDPAKRWVYSVDARDGQGLPGKSGRLSLALEQPRPDPIKLLPNGYFAFADGKPFVPLGGFYANWVQKQTPDGEWSNLVPFHETTDEEKVQWMKFLHDNGVTTLRFMLRTHHRTPPKSGTEALDIGGRVNKELFADVLRYLDLGRQFDMKFQLVVHDDYDKIVYFNLDHFRQFSLPAFAGENLDALPAPQRRFIRDHKLLNFAWEKYTAPDAIACQDLYARELATDLRGNPQVFAYELENEMVNCPAAWANHATDVLRSVDPATLVGVSHGGGGLLTADPLWWRRNVHTDYYDYHLYPHGPTTTPELDYGAAVDVLTRYGQRCGVCKMGESAGDQFSRHPDVNVRRWVMRDLIWMALASGNPGMFFWNARGPEIREFKLANDAMARLDLATFRRAKPTIGIDVRHPLDDDKYFRDTPEGKAAYAMMGRYAQHYLSQGIDFDFTVEPGQYAQSAGLGTFAPPVAEKRYFQVGTGWQLKYLAQADWREALVYVRNFAGIEPWDYKQSERSVWRQYLRTRKPQSLRVQLSLPDGTYNLHVYDLDAQTVTDRKVRAGETVDLGTTDHDFAVVVKRG